MMGRCHVCDDAIMYLSEAWTSELVDDLRFCCQEHCEEYLKDTVYKFDVTEDRY